MLSNLGYDYATEKKNKEEETEIPYNTVTPDTSYVSPNDVDTTTATTPAQTAQASQKSTTTSTTGSQTNNQIANKTKTTTETVKDRTKNVKKTQTREGRPNK